MRRLLVCRTKRLKNLDAKVQDLSTLFSALTCVMLSMESKVLLLSVHFDHNYSYASLDE